MQATWKGFHYVRLIDAVRLLDTLVYLDFLIVFHKLSLMAC